MKKRNVFLLGLLVVLLAMGLVLVGCDKDDGDNSSSSNNNNNSGNPDNGGSSTLNIRLVRGPDSTESISASGINIISPYNAVGIYVKYQNAQGNWVRTYGEGFSYQWSKNGSVINNPQGATMDFISVVPTGHYGSYAIEVNSSDTIAVTVTHSDGRTASKSFSVFIF